MSTRVDGPPGHPTGLGLSPMRQRHPGIRRAPAGSQGHDPEKLPTATGDKLSPGMMRYPGSGRSGQRRCAVVVRAEAPVRVSPRDGAKSLAGWPRASDE